MKTFSLLRILNNDYLKLILFFIVCYVLSHTTFKVLSKVDYIILAYVFILHKIDDDTIVQFSLIFGVLFDFLTDNFIGVNVLFFLALSIFQMRFALTFSAKDKKSSIALALAIILIFNIYNLIFLEYAPKDFIVYGAARFVTDCVVYLLIYFFKELVSAVSIRKR